MQSSNRFSAFESDEEEEAPRIEKKTVKKPQKKNEKKPTAEKQEKTKPSTKKKNPNADVDMEYKKTDSRRGLTDTRHGGRGGGTSERTEKRQFDRRDGSGRGKQGFKKDGAGQHNWGNALEEENKIADDVEEIKQVPESEQALVQKGNEIGMGLEETEKKDNEEEKVKKDPVYTLEEFKQQQSAKKFKNKELFSSFKERVTDKSEFEGLQTSRQSRPTERQLIKPSTTTKPKKKKSQRVQKKEKIENAIIGFNQPNNKPRPRNPNSTTPSDKPKNRNNEQRQERGEGRGYPKGGQKGFGGMQAGRGRGRGRGRGVSRAPDIEDPKSFPSLAP